MLLLSLALAAAAALEVTEAIRAEILWRDPARRQCALAELARRSLDR